jgi:hypothetical protein
MAGVAEVIVRAADAGETYLTWQWLDSNGSPEYEVLAGGATDAAVGALNANLLMLLDGETDDQRLQRVLVGGAFADRAAERELARLLTDAVFPSRLRAAIVERHDLGACIRFRITPSPRLARVPWELLIVDDDRRLVEIAEIVHDPPSTVHVNRARLPDEWTDVEHLPVVFVIDPKLPPGAHAHMLRPVLDRFDKQHLTSRIGELVAAGRMRREDHAKAVGYAMTRDEFGAALRLPRSRLLYFGHVSASSDEPGSAAIHLHDTASTWGLAQPRRRRDANGMPIERPDDHRPLAAIDLLLGTTLADDVPRGSVGNDGHELWPMPSRVALIACEGGVDYRSAELFGLVVAMINSGAGLVTTTRWTLPTNRAFRGIRTGFAGRPTTELALQVDAAHDSAHPIEVLVAWQRAELEAWRVSGDLAHTPLVWASLTHTVAPARQIVRVR